MHKKLTCLDNFSIKPRSVRFSAGSYNSESGDRIQLHYTNKSIRKQQNSDIKELTQTSEERNTNSALIECFSTKSAQQSNRLTTWIV